MTTPYYKYDLELLQNTITTMKNVIENNNMHIHYALKANHNKKILEVIKSNGLGVDCVSGQEIQWAIEAGFEPSKIVFAGVGKTDEEITYAIENKIGMIHCEGLEEIEVVNSVADELNVHVDVALRLNPNLSANTHAKITTGLKENKFGFSFLELNRLIDVKDNLNNINIVGLHFHIGSQILDVNVFKNLSLKVNEFISFFETNFNELTYLNLGGGLGIDYENPNENPIPDFQSYFDVFRNNINRKGIPLHFELGRSIVGQCGKLVTKVLFIKEAENKRFAVVDAGMTELLRPALYNAYHQINFLGISFANDKVAYDIVGPICESSDCLGTAIMLPRLKRGDLLEVKSCGAYGESMRLSYNGRVGAKAVY